jgi:hypothetical protein
MVQEALNTGKRPIIQRKYETGILSEQMMDAGEPHDAPMKLSPIITNICISLLVMALLAIGFHF